VRERFGRSLTRTGSPGQVTRARATRWPWAIVLVAGVALKAQAYASLVNHRGGLIVALAVWLGFSVLRFKPLLIAPLTAALLAFAVAPHPVGFGVALGVGAFVVLIVLFFAISTALHMRQRAV
jgi:uncharacterized membrane protein (DUF485 family)